MNRPHGTRSHRKGIIGFTLTELLVAIALVVVLVGLLMGGLQKTRQAANRIACLSNLRQVGVVIGLYIADNRVYPGPSNGGQNDVVGSGQLSYLLRNYYAPSIKIGDRTPSIFVCPEWLAWSNHGAGEPPYGYPCYTANHRIILKNGTGVITYDPFASIGDGTQPMRPTQLLGLEGTPDCSYTASREPHGTFSLSRTWAIADIDAAFLSLTANGANAWSPYVPPKTAIHGGTRNILFFDMHAEPVPANRLEDGQLH